MAMMFQPTRLFYLLLFWWLQMKETTDAFLSPTFGVVVKPTQARSTTTNQLVLLGASVVPDESASDETSEDNPQPQVKLIECPADQDDMPFYTLGVNLAMQVGQDLGTLLEDREIDLVAQGFGEHLKGTLTKQGLDGQTILQNFGAAANTILQERTTGLVNTNKKAGEEYATKFLNIHTDAIQTDSGLIFRETLEGEGSTPTEESTIEFHYHGTLAVDGTVVDSSKLRGQSQTIPIQQVIPGMREGLLRMKEGGTATVICPSDLAYGDAGAGQGVIPGGSTLQFEVELVKVVKPLFVEEKK